MAYPTNYRYTKEHEWIELNGAECTAGITDYAQSSLGDIVFIDLPSVGTTLQIGKAFGSVESVKAVSDLFAPVSGTVTEVNKTLSSAPEQVNADAHAAWIVRVRLSNPIEVDALLDAAAYENYVAEEAGQ